jgi:hypothetical protein
MPANLYGVANPVCIAQFVPTIASGNVNCPIGTETAICTSAPFIAVSPGWYYPVVWACILTSPNGTGLTGVNVGARIGAGADFWGYGVGPGPWQNTVYNIVPFVTVGPASSAPWTGAGSTISFTFNPTGQSLFVGAAGTTCVMAILRAPDQ